MVIIFKMGTVVRLCDLGVMLYMIYLVIACFSQLAH